MSSDVPRTDEPSKPPADEAAGVTRLHPSSEAAETAGSDATSHEAAEGEDDARPRRRWLVVLLVVALLLCAGALTLEVRENALLTAQAADLQADLAATRADLSAHERHLDRVRRRVGGLAREIGALGILVNEDPAIGAKPQEPAR